MIRLTFAACAALTLGGAAMAQDTPLTAAESDPNALGWMQGFPPPEDKTIRFTDPDYFAFPKLRWTVCNFRELMPSVAISRGSDAARTLPRDLDPTLDAVTFTPLNGDNEMTWEAAFDANYTDGIMVLHRGTVVYERYAGCLDKDTLHGAMSVTKSITGLVAEALVADGTLDDTALVADVVPELADSAFGDATVRQVMDMTTALDYSEDYSDPEADVWTNAQAGSPLPPPEGYDGPRSYYAFLPTVPKDGTHGEVFGYRTVNADTVGWIAARAAGMSVDDWLSHNVWSRIGAEREAFFTVDSIGTPFAGGGFNAVLSDMARLGQMVLNDGRVDGVQVLPEGAVASLRAGGDKQAFARSGYDALEGWSYKGLWWITHDDHGAFAARGVHGQTIWIDPTAQMVIVRFASHPVAANGANDPTSLPAYRAVAEHLMAGDTMAEALQGGEWRIEDIAGRGVVDESPAALSFLDGGRLAGNATCNRILGSYDAEEGSLTFGDTGTTMMACPEALMEQEGRLLDLLKRVSGFEIDETRALVLTTDDSQTITARR